MLGTAATFQRTHFDLFCWFAVTPNKNFVWFPLLNHSQIQTNPSKPNAGYFFVCRCVFAFSFLVYLHFGYLFEKFNERFLDLHLARKRSSAQREEKGVFQLRIGEKVQFCDNISFIQSNYDLYASAITIQHTLKCKFKVFFAFVLFLKC